MQGKVSKWARKAVKKSAGRKSSPEEYDFFELFINTNMQAHIAAETDQYAATSMADDIRAQVERANRHNQMQDSESDSDWEELPYTDSASETESESDGSSDDEMRAERKAARAKRRRELKQMEEGKFTRPWKPLGTCKWRLLAFIGILLTMGMVRQSVTAHFRKPPADEADLRVPSVLNWGLSHMDFEQTMRYLHFADNRKQIKDPEAEGYDKAYKVRAILKMFQSSCLSGWEPGKHLSIDEMMIRFKGRLGWRQYMKDKPIKYGIKLWGLCESKTGYLINFDIYCGKNGKKVQKGLAQVVVLALVTVVLTSWPKWAGGHLYMDNFYSSLTLFAALWALKIQACGTLRDKRKGLPEMDVTKKSAHDSYDWACLQNHAMHAVVGYWKDNKLTRFLTTIHNQDRHDHTRKRRKKDGGGDVTVTKPDAVKAYTEWMGGCDIGDQKRSYYDIRIKAYKWTHHVFFWMLDTAVVNAYELYVSYYEKDRKRYSQAKFRRRLLFQMKVRVHKMKKNKGIKRALSPTPRPTNEEVKTAKAKKSKTHKPVKGMMSWYDEATGSTHYCVQVPVAVRSRRRCKVCFNNARLANGRCTALAVPASAKLAQRKITWTCTESGASICKDHWADFHNPQAPCNCFKFNEGKFDRHTGAIVSRRDEELADEEMYV